MNVEPYCVQIKAGKQPNLVRAYREAKEEAKKGEVPIGVARWKGADTLVCMSWKDFEYLLKKGGK